MNRRTTIFFILWPILAAFISLIINAKLYTSMALFFVLPGLFLSYLKPSLIRKISFFSLIAAVALGSLFDYIMEVTGGWAIGRSEFPNVWFLNYISLIQIIWLFLYVYMVIFFYEIYFDKEKKTALYPKMKPFILLMGGVFGFVVLSHFFAPSLLYINLFYLKAGVVLFLLPAVAILLKFPRLYGKSLKVASYFFYSTFIYEMTALELNHWTYPDATQFAGFIHIYQYSFPIEELFFWIMIGGLAIITWYEYFDDDLK